MDAIQATAATKLDKIEITSDGSGKGTTITINGKEVKNLSDLSFSFYSYCSGNGYVSLSYSTREPKTPAGSFVETNTFRLNPPCDSAVASITASRPNDDIVQAIASDGSVSKWDCFKP